MSTPKVTLLTWTQDPLETIYSVWDQSKTKKPLMTTAEVKEKVPREEVEKLFRAVVAQHIPVGEHINFVFILENISVSWREQAVRHRIGTKASPERIGSDIVMMDALPDLSDSSWWSQSMRIEDMSDFCTRGAFRLPETVEAAGGRVRGIYEAAMINAQAAYKDLVAAGIPMEDAREVIPLGTQHRMSWSLNMSALQHIVGKRGCWILQLGIWGPVIMGMVEELATKVHPIFREVVTPPCIRDDNFTGCVYHEEVRRRYTGDDKLPPCPLHLAHHVFIPDGPVTGAALSANMTKSVLPKPNNRLRVVNAAIEANESMGAAMVERSGDYQAFWGRNPFNGKRLK